MAIVKTTVKGQIVIPAELRKKYHISKGTRVKIVDKNGQIIIKPLLTNPVKEARDIFIGLLITILVHTGYDLISNWPVQ